MCSILNGDFGIADRQAIEILLAARIESNVWYPWVILDTDYFSLDTTGAWFNFNQDPAQLLSEFRVRNPRRNNEALLAVLGEMPSQARTPKLFIEPQWSYPVAPWYTVWLWPFLLQNCVRVRLAYPKRALAEPVAHQKLGQAFEKAMENQFRDPRPKLNVPNSLLYQAELLQRVTGQHRDWDTLIKSLTSIAARRAYLFNRKPDKSDWKAVARVMSDTVPHWTNQILREIHRTKKWTGLKGIYPEHNLAGEVKRLLEAGIVKSNRNGHFLVDRDGQHRDIVALLTGDLVLP